MHKKEEVQKLLSNLESLLANGGIARQRYDYLMADYQRQMDSAVAGIAAIKSRISERLMVPKQGLNTAKSELEGIRAAYNTGNIALPQARKEEDRINKRIDKYRTEIVQLQTVINAKSSSQVFVDDGPTEKRRWPVWAIAASVVVPVIVIGIILTLLMKPFSMNQGGTNTGPDNGTATGVEGPIIAPSTPTITTTMVDAIEKVKPSVVFVFRKNKSPVYKDGQTYWYGSGSGSIIDSRGYILTNEHVVHDAEYIEVYLPVDGAINIGPNNGYEARVISANSDGDIAVIKINPGGNILKPILLGNSAHLKDGEDVAAVGYPLVELVLTKDINSVQLGSTSSTRGSVSAQRVMDGVTMIQTDTAFNAGNSGGALINSRGNLIGIPTWASYKETVQNFNFAVAIDYAKPLINSALGK